MRKITCYVPFNGYNIYTKNIIRIVEENGYDVLPIKNLIRNPLLFLRCKLFNFNWFEDVDTKYEYIGKIVLIYTLKLLNKKIIFTLHNKHSHSEKSSYNSKLMSILCKNSHIILGLCNETQDVVRAIDEKAVNKVVIIPHPNYLSNYNAIDGREFRKNMGFKESQLVVLFMGTISKYKNVELLIDIFKEQKYKDIVLFIAGKPISDEYRAFLENKIGHNKNIRYIFKHIPDDDIEAIYSSCDLVVLPYNKSSYLNSGAVYLSFSLGKTVVCPNMGTINDLPDKSFVYNYDYLNESEHKDALQHIINQVIADYQKDKNCIFEKGVEALEYVKLFHSEVLVKEMYADVYKKLI